MAPKEIGILGGVIPLRNPNKAIGLKEQEVVNYQQSILANCAAVPEGLGIIVNKRYFYVPDYENRGWKG